MSVIWMGSRKRARARSAKSPSRSVKGGSFKKAAGRGLKLSLKVVFLPLLVFTLLQVSILKYVDPPMTARMAVCLVKTVIGKEDEKPPVYRWRSLQKISPNLIRAVLAAEDQRFFDHHGFDFVEMNEAFQDMVSGERLRGASTISMQTARTVFLWQGRSVPRKALEAYYTVLIELVWGKRRILEIYLNTADWGIGKVGAEAAAWGHFGKTAAALDPEECALLAAVLPSPHHWSPTNATAYIRERQKKILNDMKYLKVPSGLSEGR